MWRKEGESEADVKWIAVVTDAPIKTDADVVLYDHAQVEMEYNLERWFGIASDIVSATTGRVESFRITLMDGSESLYLERNGDFWASKLMGTKGSVVRVEQCGSRMQDMEEGHRLVVFSETAEAKEEREDEISDGLMCIEVNLDDAAACFEAITRDLDVPSDWQDLDAIRDAAESIAAIADDLEVYRPFIPAAILKV